MLRPPKPKATLSQRSLGERAKRSERAIARRMQDIDGRDPEFSRIASSTGRVGHITNLRFDAVSTSYVIENKNRILPGWLIKAWILIQQRASDFNKHALLHVEPPNMPKTVPLNGQQLKMDNMAIIGQTWHEYLIMRSKKLELLENYILGGEQHNTTQTIEDLRKILRGE